MDQGEFYANNRLRTPSISQLILPSLEKYLENPLKT